MENFELEQKLYNDCRVDVSKFFEKGRTKFVKTRREAEELTKKRGYFYDVFIDVKNYGHTHYGYGIPN